MTTDTDLERLAGFASLADGTLSVEQQLIDEAEEQRLSQYFPVYMLPEEYAARRGAFILMFSLHQYRYRDPHLQAWLQRLGEILCTPGLVAQYQEQYLTPEELVEIRAMDEDDDAWCCLP
jgi:hypothetical protein